MRFFFILITAFTGLLNSLVAEMIPITLEIAKTAEEKRWGLMNRSYLPENHGMLFYESTGSFWMFNTLIDLSIAFLDKKRKVIETAELKAYPEIMDPARPVNSLNDMWKYPSHDKIIQFFLGKRYPLPKGTKYVLEMNKGWFLRNQVNSGDELVWEENSSKAYVKKIHPRYE